MATSTVMMAALAAAKVRRRKRRRSKSGSLTRSSHHAHRTSSSAAAAKSPRVAAEVQPHSLPWMRPRVRQKRPAVTRATPVQSRRWRAASPHRRLAPVAGHEGQRERHAECADRQVEPEDGRPAPALDEKAADDGTEGGGQGADGAEQAGPEALAAPREGGQQDGQRRGDHGGGADRLHHAEGDEQVHGAGQGAAHGGQGEEGETAGEQALVAEAVGQAAAGEEEHGQHQVVAVHHPRHGDDRRLQAADHRRDGDAHDGGVGERQEDARRHRQQHEPGIDGRAG